MKCNVTEKVVDEMLFWRSCQYYVTRTDKVNKSLEKKISSLFRHNSKHCPKSSTELAILSKF